LKPSTPRLSKKIFIQTDKIQEKAELIKDDKGLQYKPAIDSPYLKQIKYYEQSWEVENPISKIYNAPLFFKRTNITKKRRRKIVFQNLFNNF
jgi:hypothetical protein